MKKILIIEDEKVLLEVLEKKLTNQGYEVVVAQDGSEGIGLLKKEKPDLVLLDIIMPKKDGFEVLTEMKADQSIADIPVIIISNSGQPVEIDKALKLGVRDYLVKTEFEPEEVIGKVEKVLGAGSAAEKKANIYKKSKSDEKKSGSQSKKIMIVEDDKFLRELIIKKIENEGYGVVYSVNGEEALPKIKEENPSLILLDLILPGIDGFEVLKQVKNDSSESVRKIPVIILSNLGQRDDVEKGINLGATDFLIKAHFTPGEIIEKVKEVLDKIA